MAVATAPEPEFDTREEWLRAAGHELAAYLKAKSGFTVPDHHVSVGFPKAARGRGRAIGQCWYGESSKDGSPHLFVCPTLAEADRVMDVYLHEMCHAVVGAGVGHKGDFVKLAKKVGLVKPWTATTAGEELAKVIKGFVRKVGPYPHAALTLVRKVKQTTRNRLFMCECDPPVKVRSGRDELEAVCKCCNKEFRRAVK